MAVSIPDTSGPGGELTVTSADTDAIRIDLDPLTRVISFRPGEAGWRFSFAGTDGDALVGGIALSDGTTTTVGVPGWRGGVAAVYVAAAGASDTLTVLAQR